MASRSALTVVCSHPLRRRPVLQLFINMEFNQRGPCHGHPGVAAGGPQAGAEWALPLGGHPYVAVRGAWVQSCLVRKRPVRIASRHFHPGILYMEASHSRVFSITPGAAPCRRGGGEGRGEKRRGGEEEAGSQPEPARPPGALP